jgi:hypothetical protein
MNFHLKSSHFFRNMHYILINSFATILKRQAHRENLHPISDGPGWASFAEKQFCRCLDITFLYLSPIVLQSQSCFKTKNGTFF